MSEPEPESFGHLGTDEPARTPYSRKEWDQVMLAGCFVFTLASALQLIIVMVPFALFTQLKTGEDLARTLVFALPPVFLIGAAFSWYAGVPGYCGSLSGLVPAGVFIWLRLREAVTGIPGLQGFEPADFPYAYSWAIPILYALTYACVWYGILQLRFKYEEWQKRRAESLPDPE